MLHHCTGCGLASLWLHEIISFSSAIFSLYFPLRYSIWVLVFFSNLDLLSAPFFFLCFSHVSPLCAGLCQWSMDGNGHSCYSHSTYHYCWNTQTLRKETKWKGIFGVFKKALLWLETRSTAACVQECIDHFMVRIREDQVTYLVSCDLLIVRFPTLITSLHHILRAEI